jgi:plasmid maintenance system killer protein
MAPQDKRRSTQYRLCFNCGKPGHIARNCRSGAGNRQNNGRRGKLSAGRGVPVKLNAVLRGPSTGDELEEVIRRLQAVNFAEPPSDDVSCVIPDSEESSTCSEMTGEEYMTVQILTGAETAEKFYEDLKEAYWNNVARTQVNFLEAESNSQELVACKTNELEYLKAYRTQVFYLVQAVKQQINERSRVGIQRSRQYWDQLANNLEYLPRLEHQYQIIKKLSNIKEVQLRGIQKAENVAKMDHPRHSELAWSFCYTDSCSIHHSTKEGSGYWPKKKKPVYWEQAPRYRATVIDTQFKDQGTSMSIGPHLDSGIGVGSMQNNQDK